MIETIVAVVMGLLAVIGALLARNSNLKANADQQRQRADAAQADAANVAHIADARAKLQAQHREQQRDSEARLAAGQRDHLNNEW